MVWKATEMWGERARRLWRRRAVSSANVRMVEGGESLEVRNLMMESVTIMKMVEERGHPCRIPDQDVNAM